MIPDNVHQSLQYLFCSQVSLSVDNDQNRTPSPRDPPPAAVVTVPPVRRRRSLPCVSDLGDWSSRSGRSKGGKPQLSPKAHWQRLQANLQQLHDTCRERASCIDNLLSRTSLPRQVSPSRTRDTLARAIVSPVQEEDSETKSSSGDPFPTHEPRLSVKENKATVIDSSATSQSKCGVSTADFDSVLCNSVPSALKDRRRSESDSNVDRAKETKAPYITQSSHRRFSVVDSLENHSKPISIADLIRLNKVPTGRPSGYDKTDIQSKQLLKHIKPVEKVASASHVPRFCESRAARREPSATLRREIEQLKSSMSRAQLLELEQVRQRLKVANISS